MKEIKQASQKHEQRKAIKNFASLEWKAKTFRVSFSLSHETLTSLELDDI